MEEKEREEKEEEERRREELRYTSPYLKLSCCPPQGDGVLPGPMRAPANHSPFPTHWVRLPPGEGHRGTWGYMGGPPGGALPQPGS